MAARKVPSSITPLPQESFGSGSSSGNSPYFEGPKNAACVLARKIAAISRCRFCQASPAAASNMTAISKNFVPIVTVRLLKRSARKPPVIENNMNGTENSAPATKTSRSRSAFAKPVPRMRKTTRFLKALSLNAPWNWVTTSDQNPFCHDCKTRGFSGRSAEEVGCSSMAPAGSFAHKSIR